MRPLKSLADTPGMPEAIAAALTVVESRAYVVADAYTHAPITPIAPMPGRMGIAADVARDMPGMTALPLADVSPDRRAEFADHLDRMARMEADASDRAWAVGEQFRAQGNTAGTLTARKRANRAAEESDRLSDRAHYVRKFAALTLD